MSLDTINESLIIFTPELQKAIESYPNQSGRGLDFKKILTGPRRGEIESSSGHEIDVEIDTIGIMTLRIGGWFKKEYFTLSAMGANGMAVLAMTTKHGKGKSAFHHPDFFVDKFIDVGLAFLSLGKPIYEVGGRANSWSDINKEYWEIKKPGISSEQAIAKTRIGKQLTQKGFSQVFTIKEDDNKSINFAFQKPATSPLIKSKT